MTTSDEISQLESRFPYRGVLTIRPTMELTPDQRRVELELAEIVQNLEVADASYDRVDGTRDGHVINIDFYRCLHPLYGQGDPATLRQRRTQYTPATYAPAKKAAQDRFRRSIIIPNQNVIIMGGGPASGKSTAVAAFLSQTAPGPAANTLTYDTSLSDGDEACQDIEAVLQHQGAVTLYWVYRPFELAMQSMVQRAQRDGRFLTARRLAMTHQGSREAILRIAKTFGNDSRVAMFIIDNSGGLTNFGLMDLARLESLLYATKQTVSRETGLSALEACSRLVSIPQDLYAAIAL